MMKLHRSTLFAGILAFGLAACGDDVQVIDAPPTPPPALSVTLTPSNAEVNVGEVADFAVGVSGGAEGASASWTCSSSNPNVASVASTATGCRATGAAVGNASITAQVTKGNQSANAGAQLRVVDPGGPSGEPATVSISSMTNVFGAPVNTAAVAGQLNTTINLDRGGQTVTCLELVIADADGSNAQVVARQNFASAAISEDDAAEAVQQITLSFNTAAWTPVDGIGIPEHLNGPKALTARICVAGVDGPTAQNTVAITLANTDFFQTSVSTSGNEALDASGRLWKSGALTTQIIPVLFSGRTVTQVTAQIHGNAAPFAQVAGARTATSAPFSVTWPTSGAGGNNVGGIEPTAGLQVVVTGSILSDGTTGPGALPTAAAAETAGNFLRLDNASPAGGTFALTEQSTAPTAVLCCSNNWVGEDYSFSAGKAGQADAGVGLPATGAVTFHVGTAGQTNAQIAATDAVTGGSDLAETTTNGALRAVAVVQDRLGNSTTIALAANATNPNAVAAGATLGVDRTAPTHVFAAGTVANQRIFNIATGGPTGAESWVTSISDASTSATAAPSGFGVSPVLTRIDRWFPGLSASARCTAPGSFSTSLGCRFGGTGTTTAVPALEGYLTYEAFATDQGGNVSTPTLSRVALNDQTAPSASNIAIPATLTGGQSTSFSADLTDNLNLWRADLRLRFGAVERLPFTAPSMLNDRFPASTLVTTVSHSQSITFVRGLEGVDGTSAPDGILTPASHVSMRVEDAAANSFFRQNAFAAGTVPAGSGFAARGVLTWAVTGPSAATSVNNTTTGAGAPVCAANTPSSRTLTARVTGATGTFTNPFAAVHFYHDMGTVDGDGLRVLHYVGSAGAPSVTDDGTTRTWTFTANFDATSLPAGNRAVMAVGVHSAGDGLVAADNMFITVCNQS